MMKKEKLFIFFTSNKTKAFLYTIVSLFFIISTFGIALGLDKIGNEPSNFEVCIDCCDVPGSNSVVQPAVCTPTAPAPKFVWSYGHDPVFGTPGSNPGHNSVRAGLSQDSFWIQISTQTTFPSPSLVYDSGWSTPGAWAVEQSNLPTNPDVYSYTLPSTTGLNFSSLYYWRLAVGDSVSDTLAFDNFPGDLSGSFTTMPYCSPTTPAPTFGVDYINPIKCISPINNSWSVLLSWIDETTDESKFEIYVNRNDGNGYVFFMNSVVSGGLVNQAIQIPPSVDYDFRVRAVNSLNSETSAWYYLGNIVTPVCNADLDSIDPDEVNCDCVEVDWTTVGNVADVNHYEVYRGVTNNPYGTDIAYGDAAGFLDNVSWDPTVSPSSPPNNFLYRDCDISSGNVKYLYMIRTCFDLDCSDSDDHIDSYDETGEASPEGISNSPCQDLPRWEEGK